MPRGDQVSRQWKILQILETKKFGASVPGLAKELGTNVRTIYRDMEALEAAGFPLYQEKSGGAERWLFVEGYRARMPLPLDMTEIMALSIACDHLKAFDGTIFSDALKKAFGKIRSLLKPEAHNFIDGLTRRFHVGFKGRKDYRRHRDTVDMMHKAMLDHRTIRIRYASSKGEVMDRRVDPYHIWFMGGTIYVVAFCHERGQVRLFVLDRIERAEVTEDGFDIPHDFSMDDFTKGRFRVMDGEPVKVKIRFAKNLAQYVKERVWHASQSIAEGADGSVTLAMTVEGEAEVKNWALSFGANAEVLAPESLRASIAQELEKAAAIYG